ncbi:unnamed protein product [Rhizophagus irregularis]|nr:unnamed protein product [Rhizophagus irregularis]CAB5389681.1 unnamed protein product [Rhizophagus irregularis]
MEDSYSYNINMLEQSDFENVEQMQYESFEEEEVYQADSELETDINQEDHWISISSFFHDKGLNLVLQTIVGNQGREGDKAK